MFKFTNINKILNGSLQTTFLTTNKNSLFKFTPLSKYFSTQAAPKNENKTPEKKNEDELKPEPFIPLEKMSIGKIMETRRNNLKETYYYFGSEKKKMAEKNYNVMEFFSKKLRRDYIRIGEIDSHKHIIPVKRLRTKADTIQALKKNREFPAVIEGREEFPDVDLVIDRKFIDNLQKKNFYHVRPYYLKLGNELIRCTIAEKEKDVRFQRFIVGRPNLLSLNLKLVGRHLNPLLQDLDLELAQFFHRVDVWVTIEDYPPQIEIDCRLFGHKKPFKFVDLIKILPEGVWLHRKYDSFMYQSIVSLGENYNLLLASNNFPVVDPEDPEEEKIKIDSEELMNPGKSINPKLRAEILKELPSIDFNDENIDKEIRKDLFQNFTQKELEELNIKELDKEEKKVDKKLSQEELEMEKEQDEDEEEEEEGGEEDEEDENGMGIGSKKVISEDKIGDILDDLSKRKKQPKGSFVPLSAASSKKLMANKFETNSVSQFKKAQAKGAGAGAKKDTKKKK